MKKNNIFRWYRAGAGRYTQSDPVGLRAGINLFAYAHAHASPVFSKDPLGLFDTKHNKMAAPGTNTIVCDGQGGVTAQLSDSLSERDLKCWGDCILAHELEHLIDAVSSDPTICKGKPKGLQVFYSSEKEAVESEYKGYLTETDCLKTKIKKGLDNCCKQPVLNRLNEAYSEYERDWVSRGAKSLPPKGGSK